MSLHSSVLMGTIIQFSTSDNAFLAFWSVHSISVISSCTLVWPYMENNEISLGQSGKVDFASFLPTKQQKKNTKQKQTMSCRLQQKSQTLHWNYFMKLFHFTFHEGPTENGLASWAPSINIIIIIIIITIIIIIMVLRSFLMNLKKL